MGLGKNGLAVFVFPGLVPGGLAQVSAHLLSQPQHFYLFSVKKRRPGLTGLKCDIVKTWLSFIHQRLLR